MNIKKLIIYLYQHRFIRYLVVGGSTFLIDFSLLYTLYGNIHTTITFATSAAYWVSIVYNFTLNRYWTFDTREKENLKRHITTYMFLLVGNYFFTVIFVAIFSSFMYFIVAKILAVAIQMTWTYVIYKNFIFVKSKQS